MRRRSRLAIALGLGILLPYTIVCSGRSPDTSSVKPSSLSSALPPPEALTAQEKAEGWVLLFDGNSFDGWRGIGRSDIPAGGWTIEDRAIKRIPSGEVPRQADGQPLAGGDLMTDRTFRDFELVLDWKISPGGNSGIKYNVSEDTSMAIPPRQAAIGFEYQVLDDDGHPDALVGPQRRAAALYDLVPALGKKLRPVGEYNEARIVFRGDHGEHWLNGVRVLEFELETPEMRTLLARSKYKDIPSFAEKREGHIVLQDHGDVVWFRRIRIRVLGARFFRSEGPAGFEKETPMPEKKMNRRDFMTKTAAGAAALAAGVPVWRPERIRGANDRIRVGVVGFSDRARYSLLPAFLHQASRMNFELAAVSDIWRLRREEAVAFLEEKTGQTPRAFRNNEEMYASRTVDAVIISTADFQHALHTVEAVEAGLDVYVEKPFANTMEDARAALRAVRKSGRIVQVGTQRRSSRNYVLADEYLRSGRFGDILAVEMTWNVNQPGRWRRPKLVELAREEDVDWRRFLLNRPYEPWNARKFVEYRLFWPYSSGIPCQWMVHQIDTVHWYSRLSRPRSVVVNGGIYCWKDGRQNYDTLAAVFDYGPPDDASKGFQVIYASRMHNSAGGVKEIYYSNAGALNLESNRVTPEGGLRQEEAEVMGLKENRLTEVAFLEAGGVETAAVTGEDEATLAHMRNWMECVRSRGEPNAGIQAAYSHSVALCMTIAAMQTGKRIAFDDERQEVVVG